MTNVGQVAVANWPDAAFTPVAGVRVQTLATLNGEIAAARTMCGHVDLNHACSRRVGVTTKWKALSNR